LESDRRSLGINLLFLSNFGISDVGFNGREAESRMIIKKEAQTKQEPPKL
jgi:hypothetical protein